MREKPVTVSTPRISLLVVMLLLLSLVPFSSFSLRSADASVTTPPPTAISPTGGTGSPASLGTIITSGTSSIVPTPLCTASCVITGGTRAGNNLFHSFGDFNIGALDSARFQTGLFHPLPDASVSNILGRVTGVNPSNIFGTLDSATYYPSANLFLMNPNGIIFGPNATLNVGGSVTFTTSNNIKLTSGWLFDKTSDPAADLLLSAAPIESFGFLGPTAAPITVYGITVQGPMPTDPDTGATLGQKITLVGGDINFTSDPNLGVPSMVTAPGRQIQITSVAGAGEVAANSLLPEAGMALGTVTLDPGTVISTAGDPLFGDGSGGAVSIRGGQFVATGPETRIVTSSADGSFGSGGAVTVDVTGSATFTDSLIQTKLADISLAGAGGSVSITANDDLAMTRTTIDASALFAGGDAGPVTLKTNGSLSLTDSRINTFASAPGNGGAVMMAAKDVTITRSAVSTDVDTGFFDLTIDLPALGQVHPGPVTVTAENTVTVSGSLDGSPLNAVISATASGTLLDAGSVTITGKTVNLSNGTIVVSMNEGQIPSPGNGGTIEIAGNNVNLFQFKLESLNAGFPASTGKGGSILLRGADNLRADSIQLTDSVANTSSVSGGGAGTIEFQTKALALSNTQVTASTLDIGPGGSIKVLGAQTVTLQSNSVISASAVSTGIGSQGPFGAAGSVLLETQQLTMQGGSVLKAANLPTSSGNAGSITVQGTNSPAQSILIDGAGTGIFTDAQGTGAGGNITLNANSVTIQNGGMLSATTSGTVPTATGGAINVNANTVTLTTGGTMTAKSIGAGAAGDITVQGLASPAQSVLIDGPGSGIFTDTQGTGAGGNILIETSQSTTLTNGAAVSASSTGMMDNAGDAGMVTIHAGNTFLMQDSSISTQATKSGGGQIEINAANLFRLINSKVSSSVLDGTGGGGNITIDPNVVVLQNSQVIAQAVQGAGGNINITTPLFLADSTSLVSASSQFGLNGTVTIQSPTSNLSGSLGTLPSNSSEAQSLLTQRCAALANGQASSFVVAGREHLPADPGGWLSGPIALAGIDAERFGDGTVAEGTSNIEPRTSGLLANDTVSLRRLTPAGFLIANFADSEATGCHS